MKYYFAPLEGMTNYRYRNTHNKYFNGIDKYFMPFIGSCYSHMSNRSKADLDPKNNKLNVKVVPQLLIRNIDDTIEFIHKLEELGYDEINLNFGCPSGTVVPKGKGGGMLKDLDYLDKYLDAVYKITNSKISIKMRIGLKDKNEFNNILNIINKYPVYELIIHPRTVKEMYSKDIHIDVLDDLNEKTKLDIIYNGDIKSLDDIKYIQKRFPFIKGVMIGRGLLDKPHLLDTRDIDKKAQLRMFYEELNELNSHVFDKTSLLKKNKELWNNMINSFDADENIVKRIFRSKTIEQFNEVINDIFESCNLSAECNGIRNED